GSASISPRSPVFRLTRCIPEQARHTTHSYSLPAISSSSSSQCWTFTQVFGQVNKEAIIRLFSTGWEEVLLPKGRFAMCGSNSSGRCSVQPDHDGFKLEYLDTGLATINHWTSGARVRSRRVHLAQASVRLAKRQGGPPGEAQYWRPAP